MAFIMEAPFQVQSSGSDWLYIDKAKCGHQYRSTERGTKRYTGKQGGGGDIFGKGGGQRLLGMSLFPAKTW